MSRTISPSFWAYDAKTWTERLTPKLSGKNLPYIYLYGGEYELDNGAVTILMNNALIQQGYPKNRITCNIYLPGEHLNVYWQNMFPEFLHAMYERNVPALENGFVVPIPEVKPNGKRSVHIGGDRMVLLPLRLPQMNIMTRNGQV